MSRGRVNASRRVGLCKALCLIGILALFVGATGEAQPASSPWPMAQQNATRTSAAAVTGPAMGHLSWTLSELQIGPISRSPVIGPDGTIYVGSDNGLLYAVSPRGLILWSFDPQPCITPPCNPTGLSAPAVAADGTIYVAFGVHVNEEGEGQGGLVAISPSGTELWRVAYSARAGGRLAFFSYASRDPLIGPDGIIYFSLGSYGCDSDPNLPGLCPIQNQFYRGFVAAVSPSGIELWNTYLPAPTAPALDGNNLYAGYTVHRWISRPPPIIPHFQTYAHLTALDASTGETLWDNDLGAGTSFYNSPAVGPDGTIYIGDIRTGVLYAFNPDGTEKWSLLSPGGGFTSTPAIGPDGTLYVTHRDNNVFSYSLVAVQDSGTSGVPLWTLTLIESNSGGPSAVPAVDASGVIYVSATIPDTDNTKFIAVNPDGTIKWEVELGGYAGSPPALQQDFVYVGGSLYAIGLAPPAITLQKTAVDLNGLPLKQGNVIEYTIVITNNGGPHGNNPGHEFEDRIPANTLYVEGSASASAGVISFEPSTRRIVWNGSLAPGASVTLKFQVRVMRRGGLGPLSQAPFWGSLVTLGLVASILGVRNRRALLIGLLLITSLFAFNACTVTPIYVCNQGTFHMDTDGDGVSDTNVLTDDPTTSASPDATCL